VNQVLQQLLELAESDETQMDCLTQPLRDFPRSQRGEYYSVLDITTDLWHQLDSGSDATEAMIGRWNRLFGSGANTIEMSRLTNKR
jgi:hypothetical protein